MEEKSKTRGLKIEKNISVSDEYVRKLEAPA